MHNPTKRVIQVLDLIAHSTSGLRLSEISQTLSIPKATLSPILQTLCHECYLFQDDSGRFFVGVSLYSLIGSVSGRFSALQYIHSQLQELVEIVGETCYCGVLVDGMVLYLDKVDSKQPLRVLTETGKRLPAYATSIGKALLMDCSRDQLESLYGDAMEPLTGKTITSVPCLHQQLQEAKCNGYTWECEESTEHVRCFAVPVRKNGRIIAAISAAIPLFRYSDEHASNYVENLKFFAKRIGTVFENTNASLGSFI